MGRVVEFTNGDIVVMEETPESPNAGRSGQTKGRQGMRIVKVVQGSTGPSRGQHTGSGAEDMGTTNQRLSGVAASTTNSAYRTGEPSASHAEVARRTA